MNAPLKEPLEVKIVDVSVPFTSMVVLIVKWALALLPAAAILMVVVVVIGKALNLDFARRF